MLMPNIGFHSPISEVILQAVVSSLKLVIIITTEFLKFSEKIVIHFLPVDQGRQQSDFVFLMKKTFI